ncbi:MAG: SCP-like extracellular [Phenylobacterium sp.]|nr:SCP-like extracellular [Phenylobacterium sp.]
MRAYASVCLGLFLASALFASSPARAGGFEDQVLTEVNQIRAHPQAYARELRHAEVAQARYGDGYGMAQEDPDAVEDAIDFLMRQPPLPPLQADRRLAAAARAHVAAQGPRGDVGHGGPGALGQRLQSHGLWAGLAAETISYGQRSPRDVVRQLVVDSGVPNRGHRKDLFGHAFQAAGVACGRHAEWGSMCVIDFAGAIVRR